MTKSTFSVFDMFPDGIRCWEIGEVKRGTELGTVYSYYGPIGVIVSHVSGGELQNSPSADVATSLTLVYAHPEELPTINPSELVASYMIKDEDGRAYNIRQAAEGFNQMTGELEHMELTLEPTEAL